MSVPCSECSTVRIQIWSSRLNSRVKSNPMSQCRHSRMRERGFFQTKNCWPWLGLANIHIQIHKYKHKNTNSQKQILWNTLWWEWIFSDGELLTMAWPCCCSRSGGGKGEEFTFVIDDRSGKDMYAGWCWHRSFSTLKDEPFYVSSFL